jgi:hypothetical protein
VGVTEVPTTDPSISSDDDNDFGNIFILYSFKITLFLFPLCSPTTRIWGWLRK